MRARAFAPATVANVAVGFDILGFALKGLGEHAWVEKVKSSQEVIVEPVVGYPQISTDPQRNTATAGLLQLIKDKNLKFGFKVQLEKRIPIGSGLGGSSTSAVASIVAANALLSKKLSTTEMLHYALIGEAVASGAKHADNVGPCLYGGLNFVRSHPHPFVSKVKTPAELRCVVILPEASINTKDARGLLKSQVEMRDFVAQTANLTGFILGCVQKDFALMKASLKDEVIEPQRAHLIPEFYGFQNAALSAGALGCSISGSGPAIFALVSSQAAAGKVLKAFQKFAHERRVSLVGSWISPISNRGAHVVGSVR